MNKAKISKIIVLLEAQEQLGNIINQLKNDLRKEGLKELSSDFGIIKLSNKTTKIFNEKDQNILDTYDMEINKLKAKQKAFKNSAIPISITTELNSVTNIPNSRAQTKATEYLQELIIYLTQDSIRPTTKPANQIKNTTK